MKRHRIWLALALALALTPMHSAWGYGDSGIAEGTSAPAYYIDIWIPGDEMLESWRITLSVPEQPGTNGISEVTIVQARRVEPWWSDKALIARAQRSLAVLHSLANVAVKVAVRIVPVPAIY